MTKPLWFNVYRLPCGRQLRSGRGWPSRRVAELNTLDTMQFGALEPVYRVVIRPKATGLANKG